jgi:oxygen-independent coproporphyrinogen-3 oxidase
MQTYLYVHIPFCIRKCRYCDFNSLDDSPVSPGEYIDGVVREMELRAAHLDGALAAPTLYFGGGTPSLLEPALVARVVDAAARRFGLERDAEITLEANPGTLTEERLRGYRAAGLNRLSLGVQSFDDRQLAFLGRVHSAAQARDAFTLAGRAGFANIGMDLMHSLPGESLALWRADLAEAVALGPAHLSVYGLTIEEGTPLAALEEAGELGPLPGDDSAEMIREAMARLAGAGYEQYEIANFARPGCRSRHNQAYWRRAPYLGFGAGAHSFIREGYGVRWQNANDPAGYLASLAEGRLPDEGRETLSRGDAMAEFMFLGLRMLDGIETERFRAEFDAPVTAVWPGEIDFLTTAGLLERVGTRLWLTPRALPVANQVFVRFL